MTIIRYGPVQFLDHLTVIIRILAKLFRLLTDPLKLIAEKAPLCLEKDRDIRNDE